MSPQRRAISAIGLEKSYGRGDERVKVLDGIDLSVERGTVFSSSARTAPARPPPYESSPRLPTRTAARPGWRVTTYGPSGARCAGP